MWISDKWKEYRLLDCGEGLRLEDWNGHRLVRPDPQAIWRKARPALWERPDAVYHRSKSGGGSWEIFSLPAGWQLGYGDMKFNIKPMTFKHTGVFPEQGANWDFIRAAVGARGGKARVLNLFAYTGGATLAAAKAGAEVCHVDAARGMVDMAKENARASGLENAPIRYIVDDCIKFVRREINRGRRYDAIIMDPPSYGRGPRGEVWRFEDNIEDFVQLCTQVLSDEPLFMLISSYTEGVSPAVAEYILSTALKRRFGGETESGELALPVESTGLALPCGGASRWIARKEAGKCLR